MVTLAVFVVASLLVLGGALGVVFARNPVYSALLLVTAMLGIAVYFVMQEAHLVAAVQVIVYASAIVVLFLFVIMLLGVDKPETLRDPVVYQRPVAVVLGLVVFLEVVFLSGRHWATGQLRGTSELSQTGRGNVEAVAETLFTDYLWPFELTAALLVIAVVGAVILAKRSSQSTDAIDSEEVRV